MGIQLMAPVASQRITMNLRPSFGSLRATENRKPTLMEFVERPHYRIYFMHSDGKLYAQLREMLAAGKSFYTPTLGIANLIARVVYLGEGTVSDATSTEIDSVIPKSRMKQLLPAVAGRRNRLMEVGQYAVEMEPSRDVTVRESIILDHTGLPVAAEIDGLSEVRLEKTCAHVVFF